MSPSDSTDLTQDGGPAKTDAYFASPELSQRADLLRHLTENSNLIPVVRGAEGMGKTTFIKHLLDLAPENWMPVEVTADVMLQPDAMLAALAAMFDQDDSGASLMDDLIRHFDAMRQDGFLPVIVVDDAHLLPEASIITLLRLHERGGNGIPLVQILLFADPEIDDLLKTPQLRVMNLQSLQLLDMPEFTLEQTELYLEHLFSSEESSTLSPLTPAQIEKIHLETGGSPGLIKDQIQGLIDSAKKPLATVKKHDYLSVKSVVGAGVALVVVILILIFQKDINALFSGVAEPVAKQDDQPTLEESVYLPIPEFVKGANPEQEVIDDAPEKQAVPGRTEEDAGVDEDLGPVFAKAEGMEGEVVTKTDGQAPQQEIAKAEPDVLLQPEAAVPEKSNNVATSQPVEKKISQSEAKKIETKKIEPKVSKIVPEATAAKVKKPQLAKKPEKPVVVVKEEAKKLQQAKKPEKPIVVVKEEAKKLQQAKKPEKPVVVVKEEVKKPLVKAVEKVPAPAVKEPVKLEKPNSVLAQKKGVPAPAPVEDRSTALVQKEVPAIKVTEAKAATATTTIKTAAVVAKSHSGGFLGEGWLLKQSPSSYTIQLVGLQDERGIAKFIRQHSVSGHIAYYRTQRNGKPWFPVLYGAYSTRGRAVDARDKLPKSLVESGVWLRTLGSVQKDIRAK